jgi:tRNA U34 5-methylaminomethyl-2-thiouridine-forming methyltransferase MnmC
MNRELRITGDGSHTVYVADLDEPYHSIHGAVQESEHVFIRQGFHQLDRSPVRILEIGFGTGLNAILTLVESISDQREVYYHAVEKYPLEAGEYNRLNFDQLISGCPEGIFMEMHNAPWGEAVPLLNTFSIFKERADFRSMDPAGKFDLVYFDAFAPKKQPHLWTEDIFSRLHKLMFPKGILVSYTSMGSVRRALISCSFHVEKIPGPPGKREMIRAIRI